MFTNFLKQRTKIHERNILEMDKDRAGMVLGIVLGCLGLVAFVLPWFVTPNSYIFWFVVACIVFAIAWTAIVISKRKPR